MTRSISALVAIVAVMVVATGAKAGAKGGPFVLTDREEVAFRTNDDGVTLRVVTGEGESYTPGVCDEPGCLPKECQPVRSGYLAASTREAVGEGYFDVYRRGDHDIRFLAGGSFGGIVEQPVSWVIAQVGPSVARVDARFVNGSRDSVEPRDGMVALASLVDDPAAIEGAVGQVRLVARDADGERIGRLLVRPDTPWPSPADECGVGGLAQDFPEATGRAPDDSAAAQELVIDAYRTAWSGAGIDSLTSVEDGTELAEVTRIAAERYPDYAGKIRANVEEVRFVDEDEAAVRFTLEGVGGLGGIGTAVLRDGRWLVARGTFCTLLAVGGVYCPVPPDASER